jgi:tetratricopeptide (TPR) repeat protein
MGDIIKRKGDDFLHRMMATRRITTVTAGAGYGKTTFVAQAVAAMDNVWYRLAGSDRDFSVFLNYLAAGIGRYYPGFEGEARGFLQDEMTADQDAQAVLTSFLHGMERHVDRPLMIVLDDFHEVLGSPAIIESVQFLVENLPGDIHIVLVSRIRVGLTLSRLRVMREVTEIAEKDLAFSPSEVSMFFSEIFGMSLEPGAVDIIHTRSQGWVSGLILFYLAIRDMDPGDVTGFITRLHGSGRSISEYLEENVFSYMPERSRDFLLKTSILSRLKSSLCDAFLGISDSAERLRYLEKNHFFTTLIDEAAQEYTYHNLFRDFLSSAWGTVRRGRIRALHRKAAELCERSDMVEDTVSHYLYAGEYGEAIRILATEGMKMLAEGRINLLNSLLDRMPGKVAAADPWLIYRRGCISEVSGLPRKAMEELRRAREIFGEQGIQAGMDLCDFGLGNIYCPMGYFREAEGLFLKVLESPSCDPMISLMIRAQMVFIAANLGKIDDADRYYREGMRDAALMTDVTERGQMQAWFAVTHGVRYIMSGDMHKAISRVEEARLPLEKSRQYRLLNSYYNHISLACYHAGLFEKGLEHAVKGLALLREKGFRDNLQGWLLLMNCFNCVGLRRIPEAFEYGRQARKSFQDFGSPWGEAFTCAAFGMLFLRIGELDRSEDSINEGLALLENMDFPHIKGQFILGWHSSGPSRAGWTRQRGSSPRPPGRSPPQRYSPGGSCAYAPAWHPSRAGLPRRWTMP